MKTVFRQVSILLLGFMDFESDIDVWCCILKAEQKIVELSHRNSLIINIPILCIRRSESQAHCKYLYSL